MNIVDRLKEQALRRPDAPAILERRGGSDRVLSFADLEAASRRAAALLCHAGLKPGDAVLLFIPMSVELYIALAAVFRLGLVATFLDPASGREHIEQCCAIRPPKGFIATSKAHLLRLLSPALRRIPHKFSIGPLVPGAIRWEQIEHLSPLADISPDECDSPALLTFTSGSTGQPKAAVRTQEFLLAQHHALAETIGLKAGEVDLATLPLFVLANLASGLTSLIAAGDLRRPGSIDPAPIVAQIRAHRPTRAGASPAFFECLTDYCEEHGLILPEFTHLFTGGGPVFPDLMDRLRRIAPNAEISAVYGSTEAEPIARVAYSEMREDVAAIRDGHGLLAGQPTPLIQLRILPDQWGRPMGPFTEAEFTSACLSPGKAGEIVVSGAHVLLGYLNGQGEEQTKVRVGSVPWHRTGDAGYVDLSGRLWLLGRCSARIEDERGTLYPFAVECAVRSHLGVRRAALVGHQGRRLLIVEPAPAAPPPDCTIIKAALTWAELDEVKIWKRIPVDRRHNSKIDYPALWRKLGR